MPFFFSKTNVVLLRQVRVTEVDENKSGIFKEILDIGDITITFDRPTHTEDFTFYNINNSSKVALKLRSFFSSTDNSPTQQIWYRGRKEMKGRDNSLFNLGLRSRYV